MAGEGDFLRDQYRIERILKIVGDVVDLLERQGVGFWPSEFKRCGEKLSRAGANEWGDEVLHLARTIKRWYGGMGSFNDLYLWNEQDRLDQLREELGAEIRALLRANPVSG